MDKEVKKIIEGLNAIADNAQTWTAETIADHALALSIDLGKFELRTRGIPPDPDNLNNDRAMWGGNAIASIIADTRTDPEDALCDLLGDLRHWADRHGMVWDDELARGMGHYEEETLPIDGGLK